MAEKIHLGADVEKYLEKEIQLQDGFIGVRLDEDTVGMLERKLAEQRKDLRIFWLLASDSDGRQVLIVPKERVQAKTFPSQQALWDHVGKIKFNEVEDIKIFRWSDNPDDQALLPSTPNPNGPGCITTPTLLKPVGDP